MQAIYSSCAAVLTASLCVLLQSSVGPQPDSTVPNPGSMTFGTAQRLPKPGKDGVPGPGQQHTKLSTSVGSSLLAMCFAPSRSSSLTGKCKLACDAHAMGLHASTDCTCEKARFANSRLRLCVLRIVKSAAMLCCCLQATTVFPQPLVSRQRASAPHYPAQCLEHQRVMMLCPRYDSYKYSYCRMVLLLQRNLSLHDS